MSQCLPTKLDAKDSTRLHQSFERLQSVGLEHMKWLAGKANISSAMQQQITSTATSRVNTAAKGSCEAVPSLIQEYRDKCAALFENVTAAQKEPPHVVDPVLAKENADSAAKFILSTCYEAIDDISRISSYARMMKWHELPADAKNIMKPVDTTFFEGWEVDQDGMTYFVSVNRGHFKGRPTEVCQVMAQQRAGPIISRITRAIKTRAVGSNDDGGQIKELYELVAHPSVKSGAMIVQRAADDRAFFTVAFMGIK
ncbi:hypothetical protein ABIF07_005475 [Bradyrhizobium elkanii]|uniref:hypothetical protein n=1 Tax=Bradyrhizobium elkanii TaxID=29448 RepID=UPI00216A9472|nr:hypothetical protein [Bradyrhizobium elkanii]MCS3687498.1 hypothetical protein [Bradyrhizobium elkanii]